MMVLEAKMVSSCLNFSPVIDHASPGCRCTTGVHFAERVNGRYLVILFDLSHRTLILGSAEEADIAIVSHRDFDLLDSLDGVVCDMDIDTEWLLMVIQLLIQGSLQVQGSVGHDEVTCFS